MGIEQPPIERIHHLLDAFPIRVGDDDAQFLANGEQKLHRRHTRIQYHRDIGVMRDARQQRAHDRGLARAHLAGQLDEAPGFIDAIQQMRQGFRVTLAQIEITRVWRDGKGLFGEPKEA